MAKVNWEFDDKVLPDDLNEIGSEINDLHSQIGNIKIGLDAHKAETAVHGATIEATPNRIAIRDSAGQFEVGEPTVDNHVVRKIDLDEVKQSVNDGKTLVAAAITDKGVPTAATDTFQTMADNILDIETDPSGDANAIAADLLSGKTAYSQGQKILGTMPNRGAHNITPGASAVTIPQGYHSGAGQVAAVPNLSAGNIRHGVTVGGVAGSFSQTSSGATAAQILIGRDAFVNGAQVNGSMPNRGSIGTQTISTQNGEYTIPAGYHNGAGKVRANFANLTAANVRQGINIGGIVGTLIAGKRSASGTTTSSSSILNKFWDMYREVHSATINASGIGFVPRIIIAYAMSSVTSRDNVFIVYLSSGLSDFNGLNLTTAVGRGQQNLTSAGFSNYYVLGSSAGYVDSRGFVLPCETETNRTFTWVAYE